VPSRPGYLDASHRNTGLFIAPAIYAARLWLVLDRLKEAMSGSRGAAVTGQGTGQGVHGCDGAARVRP
jgi:hypothetical protein